MAAPTNRKRAGALVFTGLLGVSAPLVGLASWQGDGPSVETAVVALRPIHPSVLASGQITHEDEVNLTSQVVGKIEEVQVREGQPVRRGDVLLRIDSEAYAAEVAEHRAAVRLEEIDITRRKTLVAGLARRYEAQRKLFRRQLLDAHSFEAMRDELNLARIDLASSVERLSQARARLEHSLKLVDRTLVRAPIDGVVTALEIEAGETAVPSSTNIPGSKLMTIADPASLVAEVHVDEADIAAVRVGQSARIVPVAGPERPLSGAVEFVANTAKTRRDRRGLSFLVRIRVAPAGDLELRPGMSCRAEILTGQGAPVLAAPMQAFVAEETPGSKTHEFVYVVRQDTAHKVAVRTGRSDDGFQEIVSGVIAGERVVTGPGRVLHALGDGGTVRAAPGDDILMGGVAGD